MFSKLKKMPFTQMVYKLLFQFVSLLFPKKGLIMFESYLGKQYSCNPRAIYEYLKETHPELELIWSVDPRYEREFIEKNIPYSKRFSIKWLFFMARAQFWITNSRMPLWIPKPRKTIYLQTWHGTPLKKLAHDMGEVLMPGTTTEEYKEEFYQESRNWDYLISPNRYSTDIFKRAFKFDKRIIESGYPRNDIFYKKDLKETVAIFKKQHQLPEDKKVILYAPTWRDNQYHQVGKYKFDLHLDLKKLRNEIGEDYIIILRMHYLVAENFDLSAFEGFAYDFSKHEDIRELYLISDLLITDYSSVFFDYANLKRPIIFYAYDLEEYKDDIRGFYFNFEEKAPGPIVKTTEQVLEKIKEIESGNKLSENYEEFYKKFCYLEDGNATSRVVDVILNDKLN
ncbi:CDP-glycerol:poly(Glycerophosphate) glycerophosphotransferase [Mesobacillus thioparans]